MSARADTAEQAVHQGDVGFDPSNLEAARLLNTPRSYRRAGAWALGLLMATIVAMFLPWQQNIRGEGIISALKPEDRPQYVPSLIAGRIDAWYVDEGAFVTRGTPLVRISEVRERFLDPNLVERLGEQVAGKSEAVASKRAKARSLDSLIVALEQNRVLNLDQARNRVRYLEAAYAAARVDSMVEADRFERRDRLYRDGLSTRTEYEANLLKLQQAGAKLVEQRQSLENARLEVAAVEASYAEKIQKAKADLQQTRAEVGEGDAEVAKLRNEYASMKIRDSMYVIEAPQDGYVVRAVQRGVGETVKEGDALLTVVPARPDQAAAVYVRAVDVPLLARGRKVRLLFDGWPAIQFSGWPSVSVGTFGGIVQVIDLVDSKDGKFRILVSPDPEDEPWPTQLRMGTGVKAWAMLDEVPVWFEIWRQLNGFPPTVRPEDADPGLGPRPASVSSGR